MQKVSLNLVFGVSSTFIWKLEKINEKFNPFIAILGLLIILISKHFVWYSQNPNERALKYLVLQLYCF